MPVSYELRLSDQNGQPLGLLERWASLSWSRRVNTVGAFIVRFPREAFDRGLFGLDRRLQIWRQPEGGSKQLIMSGFLRYLRQSSNEQGQKFIEVAGPDAMNLLFRRVVAANSGTSEAEKSGTADDVMKEYVDENLGSSAAAGRDITAYGFSVQADLSDGPSIEKAAARRNLLATLQEIAADAYVQGTPTYFDIVHPTPSTYEFRTFTSQRGVDRSLPDGLLPIVLSEERGTLIVPDLIQDWRDEITFVYAAGQGTGASRTVVELEDTTRTQISVFNRREGLFDGRNYDTSAKLTSAGRALLNAGRPRITFAGDIPDVPGNRFGLDWNFGDRVTASYLGELYTVIIGAINGQISQDGYEQLRGRLIHVS